MASTNWPRFQMQLSTLGNVGYDSNFNTYDQLPWVELTGRTIRQWTTQRGRQYELDQVQTGTLTGIYDNRDGALDPANPSSPLAGTLVPYNQARLRAQWPATTNRLTIDQATAGEGTPYAAGSNPTAWGIFADTNGLTEWQTVSSTTAYQGSLVYEMSTTSATATQNLIEFYVAIPWGDTSTWSISAYTRCTTSGQTPSVSIGVGWHTGTGTFISQTIGAAQSLTGGSTAWTRVTASSAVPAGALYGLVFLQTNNAISVSTTFQFDGLQWEQNATPSAYATPGPWYNIFTGGVERYPQSYELSGTRALVTPNITDAFALLSQSLLVSPLQSVMQAPVDTAGIIPAGQASVASGPPSFNYQLTDPAGSLTFVDQTGNRAPATIGRSSNGSSTTDIKAGQSITSSATNNIPLGLGSSASCVSISNGSGQVGNGPTLWPACSVIELGPRPDTGTYGPYGYNSSNRNYGWTRVIAFNIPNLPNAGYAPYWATLWATANPLQDGWSINLQNSSATGTTVAFNLFKANSTVYNLYLNGGTGSTVYTTGTWHIVFFGIASDGMSMFLRLDNNTTLQETFSSPIAFSPGEVWANDIIGADLGVTANGYSPHLYAYPYIGDVSLVAEFPYDLTASQKLDIYNAWMTSFEGDTSGERAQRILTWAGWEGPYAIDTGMSTSLGPATDVNQLDALTCLQNVVDTEWGNHFVDKNGTYTFLGRQRRYNPAPAVVTFGEKTSAGEIPYEDISLDYDPTLLANLTQVTQETTGQVFTGNNTASQNAYGARVLQNTNQSTLSQECQDQATWLTVRYGQPQLRIESISIHPNALEQSIPNVWATLLSLELGQRVNVNRRPQGINGYEIQFSGYIEQISWSIDASQQDASVSLQISSVDATPYIEFAAMHTTLSAAAASGATTLSINNLPVQPNSASIYPGLVLTLEPASSTNSENVTVASISGSTITLASATAKSHASGVVVCEQLPSGYTDPTTWDGIAILGTDALAY